MDIKISVMLAILTPHHRCNIGGFEFSHIRPVSLPDFTPCCTLPGTLISARVALEKLTDCYILFYHAYPSRCKDLSGSNPAG